MCTLHSIRLHFFVFDNLGFPVPRARRAKGGGNRRSGCNTAVRGLHNRPETGGFRALRAYPSLNPAVLEKAGEPPFSAFDTIATSKHTDKVRPSQSAYG